MDVLFFSVVRLSEQELSLKEISKRLHISEQKVRKILITAGVWSSETSRKISSLVESGKSLDEIQAVTGLTRNAVLSYLPYERGMQNAEYPTVNALRIRKCRQNKKKGEANGKI